MGLKKILSSVTAETVEKLAGVVKDFLPGERRMEFRDKIIKVLVQRDADLETTIRVEVNRKADIMIAELGQGDTFTRRARPMVVYSGLVAAFVQAILAFAAAFTDATLPASLFPVEFWVAWGGVTTVYVIGRSAEKRGPANTVLLAAMGKRKDVRRQLLDDED